MYYFYGKSNQGHGFCPLYRGCAPLGESVIRGFTVLYIHCNKKPKSSAHYSFKVLNKVGMVG